MRPLVLVAAVRRTGSTMLSEALTALPATFVFRETAVFLGEVRLKERDLTPLPDSGVDLRHAVRRQRQWSPRRAASTFMRRVAEPTLRSVEQVGLKEIAYGPGWEAALDALGDVRVVSLMRDPRDIYLSVEERRQVRIARGEPAKRPPGPRALADELHAALSVQAQIEQHAPSMRVRYEDLCTDPGLLDDVLRFVESPLARPGTIGAFTRNPRGDVVAADKVERYKREPDERLVAEALEVAELLRPHCVRWGYG